MRLLSRFLCLLVLLHCSYAPPVTPEKKDGDSEVKDDLAEFMEYHRYLKEVVAALESDPDFRERLDKANDEDVRFICRPYGRPPNSLPFDSWWQP